MPRQRAYREINDPTEPQPVIIIARGELCATDKRLITQLLGKFGIESEMLSPQLYAQRQEKMAITRPAKEPKEPLHEYDFEQITNPEQFLVREHIESFALKRGLDAQKGFIGRTYNFLVDGGSNSLTTQQRWVRQRTGSGLEIRAPRPLPGIILKPREEVGFDEFPTAGPLSKTERTYFCARFAIQAGSVVDTVESLGLRTRINTSAAERSVVTVADQLQAQFSTNTHLN